LNDYSRIAADRYQSREFMQREWKSMWTRVWLCAGRESDIPRAGNFIRFDHGHESFIVTRGSDGRIRAFYNVCQHRGRQLIDEDRGTRSQFVCPFHSWAYDLHGKNIRVTDREVFSERALCGNLDLKQARCETWAGFLFLTMDPAAPSLLEFLADVPALMGAYRMEDMHVVKETQVEIDCNWKNGLEAFLETYHVHMTHPQTLPGVDDVYEQIDVYRNGHGRIVTPFAAPSPRQGEPDTIGPFLGLFLGNCGLQTADFEQRKSAIRDAIWQAKRAADNPFGLDYSPFTKSQILDIWAYSIFPNLTLNAHPEGVLAMQFRPHPQDPEKFLYHTWHLAAKLKPGAKLPFYMGIGDEVDISGRTRPPLQRVPMHDTGLGLVMDQDISNLLGVQKGQKSRGFAGGNRYCEKELRIQVLHAELDRYLTGDR
jgi:phenylpropionate dioxygenase-like ring-hydroxylating dioxygenase large terminal subunit